MSYVRPRSLHCSRLGLLTAVKAPYVLIPANRSQIPLVLVVVVHSPKRAPRGTHAGPIAIDQPRHALDIMALDCKRARVLVQVRWELLALAEGVVTSCARA